MIGEIAVVGDIHGEIEALERAVPWLRSWDGEVVFVGDYVNRGAHSREVLDVLVQLKDELGSHATFLLGNHDLALRAFLSGASPSQLIAHSGLATLHSYLGGNALDDPYAQLRIIFPTKHKDFLEGLVTHWETDELIISHAGINPYNPYSRTEAELVSGSHPALFDPGIELPKFVVAGHYAQRTKLPFTSSRFVCVDSGCGTIPGAPLSIVLIPDQHIYNF
ncbi:metallophosphoesterase [Plantibacter flavus]|uniref:metallophosphoesterase n=1 Tax=Plantibacter flavus TaxID=150123 RepID=UPI0013759AFF